MMTRVTKVIIRSAAPELVGFEPTKGNAPAVAAAEAHQGTGRETDPRIFHQVQPSEKAFATVRAKLAILGHELRRREHPSGLVLFEVGRHGQWRIYSTWGDVVSRLSALGG